MLLRPPTTDSTCSPSPLPRGGSRTLKIQPSDVRLSPQQPAPSQVLSGRALVSTAENSSLALGALGQERGEAQCYSLLEVTQWQPSIPGQMRPAPPRAGVRKAAERPAQQTRLCPPHSSPRPSPTPPVRPSAPGPAPPPLLSPQSAPGPQPLSQATPVWVLSHFHTHTHTTLPPGLPAA